MTTYHRSANGTLYVLTTNRAISAFEGNWYDAFMFGTSRPSLGGWLDPRDVSALKLQPAQSLSFSERESVEAVLQAREYGESWDHTFLHTPSTRARWSATNEVMRAVDIACREF